MNQVEVKGLFGQAITGFPENITESGLSVSFRYDSIRSDIDLKYIRLSPDPIKANQIITLNSHVECFIDPKSSESMYIEEPENTPINLSNDSLTLPAWWKCKVVSFDLNTCYVELEATLPENPSPETQAIHSNLIGNKQQVKRSQIRPINKTEYNLDLSAMKTLEIKVPGYVSNVGRYPLAYRQFLKHFKQPVLHKIRVVEGSEEKKSETYVTFYCMSDEILKRIELTISNNWQSLSQKMSIITRKTRFFSPLPVPEIKEDEGVTETFQVIRSLVKYCIGPKGVNINEARKIDGIINIYVNDPTVVELLENTDHNTQVTIHAKTREAAQKARATLEYVRLLFGFPYEFTGHLIGKQTRNINSIIEKTNVLHISHDESLDVLSNDASCAIYANVHANGVQFEETKLSNERYGAFIITGSKESVENARVMLMIQIESICDVNKLENSESRINRSAQQPPFRDDYDQKRPRSRNQDNRSAKRPDGNPAGRPMQSGDSNQIGPGKGSNNLSRDLSKMNITERGPNKEKYVNHPQNQRSGDNVNREGPNQNREGPNQNREGPNQNREGPNQNREGPIQNREGPNQNRAFNRGGPAGRGGYRGGFRGGMVRQDQ